MTKENKKNQKAKKPELKDIEEEIVVEQEKEISDIHERAEEYLDGWKRTQAEFENYKKMQLQSQKDLLRYSTQNIVLQILPVIDNFHASTDHIPEDQKENPWVKGIMYIQKQLEDVLTENGVDEIAVKEGDNFDPIFHEAIEDKHCDNCGDCGCEKKPEYKNKIKKVLTKGYKIGEKVIRPARVVVE